MDKWKGDENGKDKLASSCCGLNRKWHTIWLKISHDCKSVLYEYCCDVHKIE